MKNENIILSRNISKDNLRRTYSKIAKLYDFWSCITESNAAKKVLELAQIMDGEQVLEVAVGTGLVFEEIVKRNGKGKSIGLDLSPSMLSRAKRRLKKYGRKSFYLQIGNAYQLPFKANTFDLVVNNFMFDLLPEKDFIPVLLEFNRVLKPSGRVVISAMTFGIKKYNKIWYWIAKNFPSILTGCRPVSLHDYLPKAGFSEVKMETLSQFTFPTEVILAHKETV
jgi:ubiquinone/menaquinone biosynthesis C-methylase UbiE